MIYNEFQAPYMLWYLSPQWSKPVYVLIQLLVIHKLINWTIG